MEKRDVVFEYLDNLGISYECFDHPEAPTIDIAMKYWAELPSATHCKNIFLRNHKGNKHYLVVFDCHHNIMMRDLEQRLKQGKLSFASAERMERYLNLKPGSVSPFGLINDKDNHTHLFLDVNLKQSDYVSFHPNDNTSSLILTLKDFEKYLNYCGNSYEFIELY